jgi:transcriptional regulator GlxA family with amidase domain
MPLAIYALYRERRRVDNGCRRRVGRRAQNKMLDRETSGREEVGFLLVPGFSMMAFFSAVEPLRVSNRFCGRPAFHWRVFSADGAPVAASNGMTIVAERPVAEAAGIASLIVVAGFEPEKGITRPVLAALRKLARRGVRLGALDTGTFLLAAAGLIDERRVTLHWEAVPAFREKFPQIAVTGELFEIDDRVFTCAGGTAALDMMLHMIGGEFGPALAAAVSEQFIHNRIRDARSHQRMEVAERLDIANPKVARAVEAMERHLEEPLSAEALARVAGVTARQLERLFKIHLKASPCSYYGRIRLERARHLLRQTGLSVLDVALATGFASASSFARAYRGQFGHSPRADRREDLRAQAAAACVLRSG